MRRHVRFPAATCLADETRCGANQQWQLVRVEGGGQQPTDQLTNPVVWQDFADAEVIRVGDVYYMTASTMHHSAGAPILRSYDLVNWEFAVPR